MFKKKTLKESGERKDTLHEGTEIRIMADSLSFICSTPILQDLVLQSEEP